MNTAHLQAAKKAAIEAREALRAALSESSAVEALHLYPMIEGAAKLEGSIESLLRAFDADQSCAVHTNESLAKHLTELVKTTRTAVEIQCGLKEHGIGAITATLADGKPRLQWEKTGPDRWELQR